MGAIAFARARRARGGRPHRVRLRAAEGALRRHGAARRARSLTRDRAAGPATRRAVQRARRVHAHAPAGPPPRGVGPLPADASSRHARPRRGGVPRRSGARARRTAGPRRRRDPGRPTAPPGPPRSGARRAARRAARGGPSRPRLPRAGRSTWLSLMRVTVTDARGSVGTVQTRYLDLSRPLPLDSGATLAPVRIAYETYGTLAPAKDNVLLVCHALSGDAHAAGWSDDPEAPTTVDGMGAAERGRGGLGWWDGMIGPGKAFDTDRFYVVCTNLIGSCRGSTGPGSIDPRTGRAYGSDFPVLTVGDMVRAEHAFLRELGIDRVFAASGGSLGGMQALEWAVQFPDAIQFIVPIAATARLGAQGVAWNAIARNAIMSDPDWQSGHYEGTGRKPDRGIKSARMVGHITYLSDHAVR